MDVLEQERRRANFGNAGAVHNLLSNAAQRMEARMAHLPPEQRKDMAPVPEDFNPDLARDQTDAAAVFDDLIGCTQVGNQWSSLTHSMGLH